MAGLDWAEGAVLGGRARPAESAFPTTFSRVARSPGECHFLTEQPISCTALREVGGGRWRVESEPSIPFLTLWSLSFPMCKIISASCIEMCQN